jgi:UDP-N-acetylmuramate: L-alanyl-gamma-D-glutamyl-meso-diaminopimelate ligase
MRKSLMMDMDKNQIPASVNKIHLIAVCGTGMGALACLLKDGGFEVTGSDQKAYPPMSDFLTHKGITVLEGFEEKNLQYGPDLVVVGNAVSKDNPEVVAMQKLELNFCSMPQAINRFMAAEKKPILITGTHGKTTTAAILAWIFYAAGLDPSFMIGGILKNFDSNYHLGGGEYIIIEGDEYDTAFFDKGPKFLHYDPFMAILTSVEFDHADIYADMGQVNQAFGDFVWNISEKSLLVAFDSDDNIKSLLNDSRCRIENYGKKIKSAWQLDKVSVDSPWTHFQVLKHGQSIGIFQTKLMGEHNLLNTLAAVAIAVNLDIDVGVLARALKNFENVRRRQEIRGQINGITVMDDFAHHPTAVRETIKAVKPHYPAGRIIAVFEPRTHTSMRSIFQSVYPHAFEEADLICVRHPPLLKKIPSGQHFSSQKLVEDLIQHGKPAYFFTDTDSIIDFLVGEAKPGDLVLIMSNGAFDNIHARLLESL